MKIGFTGTRQGMSTRQYKQLRGVFYWLLNLREDPDNTQNRYEFHHGDAVGADAQAKEIALGYFESDEIKAHPGGSDPLARNVAMVGIIDVLIAAPLQDHEQQRGGTWHTVRQARKAGKPVIMLSRGE